MKKQLNNIDVSIVNHETAVSKGLNNVTRRLDDIQSYIFALNLILFLGFLGLICVLGSR